MTPDALVRTVEEFLSQAHDAVVLEDGAVLSTWGTRQSIRSPESAISACCPVGRRSEMLCVAWSTWRLGKKCCDFRSSAWGNLTLRNSRSAASLIAVRRPRNGQHGSHIKGSCNAYVTPKISGFKVAKFSTSMDLEQSFGPIYTRGLFAAGPVRLRGAGASMRRRPNPPLMPADI